VENPDAEVAERCREASIRRDLSEFVDAVLVGHMITERNAPFEQYPGSLSLLDVESVLSRILAHAQKDQPHPVTECRYVVQCLRVIAQDLE
jgi:hypothetical protein